MLLVLHLDPLLVLMIETPHPGHLRLLCRRHVADMSPTRVNVAKSWPTLRVVATQDYPIYINYYRHVQISPNIRVP